MPIIKVAHISDLHLKEKDDPDTNIVLKALAQDLASSAKEKPFDIAIFSGDIVFSGASNTGFLKYQSHFEPLLADAMAIPAQKIFYCPGNHDIDRETVRQNAYIERGLAATLQTREEMNKFYDQNSEWNLSDQTPPPFQRLNNFYKSLWLPRPDFSLLRNAFVSTYSIPVSGIEIGIACLNSAWRTTGEADDIDYGNLIITERAVDHATKSIESCEIKFVAFHHPTPWLNPVDQINVEARIFNEYDIIFHGHVHRAAPEIRKTSSGEAVVSQGSCLYTSREYFNGYNIVQIDTDSSKCAIIIREYSDQRRSFISAERIIAGGKFELPFGGSKNSASPLVNILNHIRLRIVEQANEHISFAVATEARLDIRKDFICPPLTKGSETTAELRDHTGISSSADTEIIKLLKDNRNIAILGRPESGKTSIGHYIAVLTCNGEADIKRIPLMGKFRDVKRGSNSLWRVFREYGSEISDGSLTADQILHQPTLLILDDVDASDEMRVKILSEFVVDTPHARWILLCNDNLPGISVERTLVDALKLFDLYTIRDLPRSLVRELSARWMNTEMSDNIDKTFRSVMEHIQRAGLPRNGYIVSLVLWTLQNKSRGEIINEAVLLQNIIDFILGKMDYVGVLRSEFDFTSKAAFLQEIAFKMKSSEDFLYKNDLLSFIVGLLAKKGLRYDADGIMSGFIACGVLQQIGDTIQFKYKRFQDFFVAGYLRDNSDQLISLFEGEGWYFFRRELDVFTSRFRHESWMLDSLKEIVESFQHQLPDMSDTSLLSYLEDNSVAVVANAQLHQMKKTPMTAKKIDELWDKAERASPVSRAAKSSTKKNTISQEYRIGSAALTLYTQMIRNLEFVDLSAKEKHIETCMDCWSRVLLHWIETARNTFQYIREDKDFMTDGDSEQINRVINYTEALSKVFFPVFLSATIYRDLGTEKLFDIVERFSERRTMNSISGLLSMFVLVELHPGKAIASIKKEFRKCDNWTVNTIIQRLYYLYTTRPLSDTTRAEFERLIGEVERHIGRISTNRQKGKFLQSIKNLAYKDE